MKKLMTKILGLSGVLLLILSSCKKDGTLVTATGGTAGTLTASTTTPVLSSARLTDTTKIIKFSFTGANYGPQVVSGATLQIDKASDNFANPTTVAFSTGVTSQSYNTADFNNLVLKLGISGGTTGQVVARVAYTLSGAATTNYIYSNTVTMTVTPFNLTSWIYVVGAFQGWNAGSPDSLISATGNGVYTGIINFTAGNNQFLILPAKNYNNKYATSQTSTPTSTVAYNASNNLVAPSTAGQYIVTFNLTAGTITFALANTYSVIGSSTPGGNYSTDLDLTKYVNDGVTGWTGTIVETAGAFKIRQNHDWTYSWGDISPADGKDATSNNGANINVAVAGTYKVTFNIPISAVGVTPSVTATYTSVKQ